MSWFGRAELGETDDPTDLVPGEPARIDESATDMRKLADAFREASDGLGKLGTDQWQGEAAEKFNSYFADETPKWRDAAEAFVPAADALVTYKGSVERGQRDAATAIRLYNEAKQATEQAEKQYEAAADEHDRAAFAATFSNDPAPTPMAPFSDPGKAKREQAQRLLEDARRAVKDAAGQAAQVITKAKDRAPEKPGLLSQLGANIEDTFDTVVSQTESIATGAMTTAGGIVKQARAMNPLDPYNISHPGEYASNMATMAAGMVDMATHPGEAVKKIISLDEWKKDPFAALGKVGTDVVFGALTGGTGVAGTTARTAGREAAEIGAREAMEQAGTKLGRQLDELPPWHKEGTPDRHDWDDYKPDEPFGPKGSEPDAPHHEPDAPEHKETPEEPKAPDEKPSVREPEQLPQPAKDTYFQLKESVGRIQAALDEPGLPHDHRQGLHEQMRKQQQMMSDIMNRHR